MARYLFWAKAAADVGCGRFYRLVFYVRLRSESRMACDLPDCAGSHGRRAPTRFASGHARSLSSFATRQGDGILGIRHRRGADAWPGAGWMAYRQLFVAMDLLH